MLPNLSDYMQAFQHPNYILSDRELASCQCPQDQQGQPIVQSGGFALTFQLKSASKRWAVRCFHREVKDRDRRYSAISAKKAKNRSQEKRLKPLHNKCSCLQNIC